jgi:hypothetical protein
MEFGVMSSQSGRCVKERSLGSSSLAFVFIEFGLFASEFGDFLFFFVGMIHPFGSFLF